MRSDEDLVAAQIVRQARPAAMGSRLNAGSSGAHPAAAGTGTTVVTADGTIKREWLAGDDWSNRFFFKSYALDS